MQSLLPLWNEQQVILKEHGPFSYRAPLLAGGPPAFCRSRHKTTGRCRRLCRWHIPPGAASLCLPRGLSYNPKSLLYSLHTIYLGSITAHNIQQKGTHNAQQPNVYTCRQRGSERPFSARQSQGTKGKMKVIQEKFYCVLLLKKVKVPNALDTFKSSVCLYVGIEGKTELQKWELWVPEQLWSSLQHRTVSKMRS